MSACTRTATDTRWRKLAAFVARERKVAIRLAETCSDHVDRCRFDKSAHTLRQVQRFMQQLPRRGPTGGVSR